jgi:hypothetical protein
MEDVSRDAGKQIPFLQRPGHHYEPTPAEAEHAETAATARCGRAAAKVVLAPDRTKATRHARRFHFTFFAPKRLTNLHFLSKKPAKFLHTSCKCDNFAGKNIWMRLRTVRSARKQQIHSQHLLS